MTIINVNSISGINSITAQGASGIEFYDSSGNSVQTVTGDGLTVGTGATISGSTNVITASTNGEERLRITSNGNVGIGTDNIGNISNRAQLVIGGDTGGLLDFNVGSDTEGRLFATDAVGLTIRASQSDGEIVFQTGGSNEQARITADGLKLASGNGINFSAYATSGNPSSNLLDDYEEGTFTPVFEKSDSSTTYNGLGVYTKVGNQVTVSIRLNNIGIDFTTGGQTVQVTGFPFTNNSTVNTIAASYINYTATATSWSAKLVGGTTIMYFYRYGVATSDNVRMTTADLSRYTDFDISITYIAQ